MTLHKEKVKTLRCILNVLLNFDFKIVCMSFTLCPICSVSQSMTYTLYLQSKGILCKYLILFSEEPWLLAVYLIMQIRIISGARSMCSTGVKSLVPAANNSETNYPVNCKEFNISLRAYRA